MANFVKTAIAGNIQLWRKTFWETWEPLPMSEKLTWIAFVGQTLGVITLIQLLLFLKK